MVVVLGGDGTLLSVADAIGVAGRAFRCWGSISAASGS